MSQILNPQIGAVHRVFKGAREFTRIYKGQTLVWTKEAAGRPSITSFTAARSGGNLVLTFAVARSLHNVITLNGVNVPLTTSTTAVIPDPGVGSHTYTLTCSNAAGAVSRNYTYTVNAAPSISNFAVAYSVTPGGGTITAFFTWDWSGLPKPVFTIDFGEGRGFESVAQSHVPGAFSGSSTRLSHIYPANRNLTARLHAGNSEGTDDASVAVNT